MQRVISFIIAQDENKQNILMNVEVDNELKIKKLNIGGYLLGQKEIDNLSSKIKINKELFENMQDNEPLDISLQFKNMSKEQIIKTLGGPR